jgi:hypothetical protein
VPPYIGRRNLRKRLEPHEGRRGATTYGDGAVRVELPDETLVVRPPFGLDHDGAYESVELGPLWEAVERDHVVAAFLVRLGGYAAGVFDGEELVASKVGTRFVKNRNKKGGSSSNRFRRRREEQARELIDAAAETAAAVFGAWRDRIEFAALGGDRRTLDAVLMRHPELEWLRQRAVPRFFTVPDPRLRTLERLPYDLYAAEIEPVSAHSREIDAV